MEIDQIRILRSIDRDLHDHEVFFSFTNDDDAILFHRWWETYGEKAFKLWAEPIADAYSPEGG